MLDQLNPSDDIVELGGAWLRAPCMMYAAEDFPASHVPPSLLLVTATVDVG